MPSLTELLSKRGFRWARFSKRPGPNKPLAAHVRFLKRARRYANRPRPTRALTSPATGTNPNPLFRSVAVVKHSDGHLGTMNINAWGYEQ